MSVKISTHAWLRGMALLLFLAFNQTAMPQPDTHAKTLQRTTDPVVIYGSDLPQLIGKAIDTIRVFAFRNGEPEPIPFQVDQRDSAGSWVWDVVYRKPYAYDEEGFDMLGKPEPAIHGPGTRDDEDPRGTAVLDANDMLVFMAEDVGDKHKTPKLGTNAALALELAVFDASDDTAGWAYVAHYPESPPPRSETHYMHYDPEQHSVESPVYSFHFSDEHMAMIHDLQVNGFPLVDQIRIRGEITMSPPIPQRKIRFTQEDVHGHIEGYIAGPVRIIKRNTAYLSIAGGLIRSPEVNCDNFYYAHHAEIPVCLSIRFPVKEVEMILATDYRDPPFHQLYMGDAKDSVDTTANGRSLQSRLLELGTEWIALDGHEASIISLLALPESLAGHAQAQPCLCPGHQTPVQIGTAAGTVTETGFRITSSAECPKGVHILYGTYLISAQPYEPGDEDAALKMKHNKLTTQVSLVRQAQ